MKIITYKTNKLEIDINEKIEDLEIIENVKEIIIMPLPVYTIEIAYRLKNKEYKATEWEQHRIPTLYNFEIKEDEDN